MATLKVKNLHARVAEEDDEQILRGVGLEVKSDEIRVLMGSNRSGKSTISKIIAGHPAYEITDGGILLHLEDDDFGDLEIPDDARTWNLLELEPNRRAALGILLGFQYPTEIEGVTMTSFLRTTFNARIGEREELLFGEDAEEEEREANYDTLPMEGNADDGRVGIAEFQKLLKGKMDLLSVDERFMQRYLNTGFSDGGKEQNEVLQTAILEPSIAVFDEIDSGLDISHLRDVLRGINMLRDEQDIGILRITHYQRILEYVGPDHVHIMLDGKVVKSGDAPLVSEFEDKGYDWVREEMYKAA